MIGYLLNLHILLEFEGVHYFAVSPPAASCASSSICLYWLLKKPALQREKNIITPHITREKHKNILFENYLLCHVILHAYGYLKMNPNKD